jgi:hypothetical protein
LLATAGVVVALGLLLLLAPAYGGAVFDAIYAGSLFPQTDYSPSAIAAMHFTNGVLGAVLIGWMTMVIAVVRGPFRRGEPFAWNVIAGSIGTWWTLDTTFSVVHGVAGNVALNVLVLIGFAVPLAATYRRFHRP